VTEGLDRYISVDFGHMMRISVLSTPLVPFAALRIANLALPQVKNL
jgi:hypothetical protein